MRSCAQWPRNRRWRPRRPDGPGPRNDVAARIVVKVVPGASHTRVAGWLGEALKVRVAAPPEKGKANAAVVDLLASTLGVPKRRVVIVSGASAANKVIEVAGVTEIELKEKLSRR